MRYYIDQPPSTTVFSSADQNTDAAVILPAKEDWLHVIQSLVWSFDGSTKGRLVVSDLTLSKTLLDIQVRSNNSRMSDDLNFSKDGLPCSIGSEIKIQLEGKKPKTLTIVHR